MNGRRTPYETLGARLREVREYVGFSEEEVARHLGLSQGEMSRIEKGSRQAGESELRRLAKLYQIRVEVLTGREQGKPGWESFPALDQASADLSTVDRNELLRFARFLQSTDRIG